MIENKKFPYVWFILMVAAFLPFRLWHFTYPLMDAFNFRQTQTATFALNMYKNGIHLFRTELDIFGTGKERFLTLEFPLYEAIVTMFYNIFGSNDYWGRVVSITSGFAGSWYLYQLVFLITKKRNLSILSAFFYLAIPLNMFYQRTFMIDPTITAFLITGTYYSCHWVRFQTKKSYALSIILLSLGFIQKALYGPFWLIPIGWYFIHKKKSGFFSTIQPFSHTTIQIMFLFLIPLLITFLWVQHTNSLNTANNQLFFTSYDAGHLDWNFGTFADRASIDAWQYRLSQLFNGILLKPGILFFVVGIFLMKYFDRSQLLYVFLLSQILYFVVLFRIQAQNYYQLVMTAAFAPFLAGGVLGVGKIVSRFTSNKAIIYACMSLVCALYLHRSWMSVQPSFFIDWGWHERIVKAGKLLEGHHAGILAAAGNEWNSAYTYYSGKKMKRAGIEEIDEKFLEEKKKEGYSFLWLIETEKYESYLQEAKPSHSLEFLDRLPKMFKESGMEVLLIP